MASWLEQYAAKLDAIEASRRPYMTDRSNAKSNVYSVLSQMGSTPDIYRKMALEPYDSGGSGGLGGFLSGAGNRAKNLGLGALDILSRPNYMMANLASALTENKQNVAGDAFKGLWEGFTGKSKKTFSDVLAEHGVHGALGGIAGFALDVGLDPTTYIGAGAIKSVVKGGIKGVEKAVGREVTGNLPKLGRSKNALGTHDVVSPGDEIVEKGADNAVAANEPTTLPYNVVPETNISRLLTAQPEGAKFFAGPEGIESNVAAAARTPTTTAQLALEGAKSERSAILQGVSSKRYAPDLEIGPLRRAEYADIPTTKLVPNPEFGAAGKTVLRDAVERLAPENLGTDRQLNLFGRLATKPTGKKLAPIDLVKMIKDGKVPKNLENSHFIVDGRKVSVKQYVNDTNEAYFKADVEEMPHIEVPGEPGYGPTGKTKTLTPTGRAAWIAKHKDILDPEDMKVVIRAANLGEGQLKKAIEKIRNKTHYKNYDTIQELEAAQKSGMITDTGRQVLEQRAARQGRKNIGPAYRAADAKVEKFQKALDEAVAHPTEKNIVAARKAQQEAVKAEQANKFAGRSNKLPDPVDDIMQNPALVDNVAQNVENLMEHGQEPAGFVKARANLDEWQAKTLEDILPSISHEEMRRAGAAKQVTRTGAKREVAAGKKGPAWHKAFNKRSQFTLGKAITVKASQRVASMGIKAADRPAAMYDMVMPMLEASEAVFLQNGIPAILGQGARGLPMSMHDALSALPRDFVEKYFFSGIDPAKGARSLDFTQLSDVVEQFMMRGLGKKPDQDVKEALKVLFTKSTRGKGKGTSALNVSIKSNKDMAKVIDEFDAAFTSAGPRLIEALRNNSVHAAVKEGQQTKALTDAAMMKFHETITNPNSTSGQIIRASLENNKVITETSKLMRPPPSNAAVNTASTVATSHVAGQVPLPVVATYGRVAKSTQDTAKQVAKLSGQLSDAASVESKRLIEKLGGKTMDLGLKAEWGFGVRVFRTIAGHLGNENIRPILMQRLSVNQTNAKRFSRLLNDIHAKHPPANIKDAFQRLQRGEAIDNPAMQDMWNAMKEVFDSDPEFGLLKRNAITAEELQAKFKHFKIPDKFVLDPKNLDQSWKTWADVEDPLNLLSKFNAAVFATVSEKELGAEVGRMFGKHVPGADGNWVKIIDTGNKSRLAKVLDPDMYFPEDIARQMHMIDTTLDELAKGSWNNSFFKVADSVTHAYKAGVTIYRPGHHARNLFGDLWLSSMDRVSGSAYKRGFAAIATASSHYKDFDALRSLQAAYKTTGGVPPKSLVRMRYGGKDVHLSPEQIYKMAYDNGVLPDYSVLEDIAFGTTAQADKVAETLKKISPARGKIHNIATTASEYRDHYVRLSHFIHSLDKQAAKGKSLKGATLEDALMNASHEAAARVRKWHPDGSDLTHMEKNVMRRTVLFYSWIRKAMPLVVESMVTKPGKVMLYPKAMQNLAYSQGIDLEGQTGFPEDQLFPDFIADGAYGPQFGQAGSYFGIQPGVPSMDIMNEYAGGPQQALRSLMGGLNPALRVPPEVASGHSLRTGGPIMDKTDYIDQLIPGGSYVDKLAGGRSLSSLFTQKNRVSKSNEGYAPDFLGGKGGMDFLNYMTGLGVTDYSVPSYQKAAQIQQGRQ